jgi:DNA-binding Lrp family transcriptional regulator
VNSIDQQIIKRLQENSRIDLDVLAKMLDISRGELNERISVLEKNGIIVRYTTLVNLNGTDEEGVTAMIDVKVTPKRGVGFDEIAERIYKYPEVVSVYLMSGAYDLSVVVEGKTMKDVALFVSDKLSTLDSVISTTTHFILKKYKHDGIIYNDDENDNRMVVSP